MPSFGLDPLADSVLARKNPLGLIEAFQKAFGHGEGPVLVIKTINGDRRPNDLEKLRFAAKSVPNVVLLEGYLSAAQCSSLISLCDCYVSCIAPRGSA